MTTQELLNAKSRKRLSYDNGFNTWLEARQQEPPEGMSRLQGHRGYTKPYYMTPEDMQAVLNAYTPYDLYNKPDSSFVNIGYPTSAFNINNLGNDVGIKSAILLASRNPNNNLSPIHSVNNERVNYTDIPEDLQSNIGQGIYEHEYGHEKDIRLNPYNQNKGYLTGLGMPGEIYSREAPAMKQEDKFWEHKTRNKKR